MLCDNQFGLASSLRNLRSLAQWGGPSYSITIKWEYQVTLSQSNRKLSFSQTFNLLFLHHIMLPFFLACAMQDLSGIFVPWPGIKPVLPALEAQSEHQGEVSAPSVLPRSGEILIYTILLPCGTNCVKELLRFDNWNLRRNSLNQ